MGRALFRFTVSAFFSALLASAAVAQDFQKSYRINAGGEVRIANVSGDVIVTGYDGDAITVSGYKSGSDRDLVEIEDRSDGSRVDVSVRYPKNCNCNAGVEFKVQVPRSASYNFDRISSVSGDVEVSGISGKIHASAVSGTVRVKDVAGSVNASSVSGDVSVEINRLEGGDDMKFSTVSGDVDVRVPASLGAEIDMSTFSGSVRSDFPLEVRKERYTSSRSARGRVGDGSRNLQMKSVSGDLSLIYSSR